MTASRQSKEQFLEIYRAKLLETYGQDWAGDTPMLDRFMQSVRHTIFTKAATWNIDSPVAQAAWKQLGMSGRISYKGLRALQELGT